jgi:CRP-like cAMP-binding protein
VQRVETGQSLPSATLRQFPILADLSDAELELVASHATTHHFDRGEYLFREGEPGDALYLLAEGVVVADRVLDAATQSRKDLAIIPARTTVGEMALADDSPRSASVRAEIPCRAWRLSRERFDHLMQVNPTVASKLFRALFAETSRRLRATNEELLAVYEVGHLLAQATDAKSLAAAIVQSLVARLDASYAVVALYESDSNQLRVRHVRGQREPSLAGQVIPLAGGLVGRAFDDKRPLLVERLLGATDPWESESMILAPLVVRDRAEGVLILGQPLGPGTYTVADLSLAAAVCNLCGPVLRDW